MLHVADLERLNYQDHTAGAPGAKRPRSGALTQNRECTVCFATRVRLHERAMPGICRACFGHEVGLCSQAEDHDRGAAGKRNRNRRCCRSRPDLLLPLC